MLNPLRVCIRKKLSIDVGVVCKSVATKLTSDHERSQACASSTDWMLPSASPASSSASDPSNFCAHGMHVQVAAAATVVAFVLTVRTWHARARRRRPPEEIVYLSVGGTPLTTRRSTLCLEPGSVLAINFSNNNGYGEPSKDKNGAYVIDRDPRLFNWVMRYLRFGGHLPDLPEDHLIRSVREEAFYWQLTGMVKLLDAQLAREPVAVHFSFRKPRLMTAFLCEGDRLPHNTVHAVQATYLLESEDHDGPIFVAQGMKELQLCHTMFDDNSGEWQVATTEETYLWCKADVPTLCLVEHAGIWNLLVVNMFGENVYREVPDLGLRIRRGPRLLTLDPERESSAAREPLASSNDSS